jgi:GNAT superfamily N-acetyltransferase
VITAWKDGILVGFARGISDHTRYAQVLDVLVHPNYRRSGVGKELIKRLLDHPSMCVRGVILGTPSMKEFYESVGFQCVNDIAYMMVLVRDEYGEGLIQPVDNPA